MTFSYWEHIYNNCTQRKPTFPHPSAEAIFMDLHYGTWNIAHFKQGYAVAFQLVLWNGDQLCIILLSIDGLVPLFFFPDKAINITYKLTNFEGIIFSLAYFKVLHVHVSFAYFIMLHVFCS